MIRATALTENCWLLSKKIGKLGLLRKLYNNEYEILGGPNPGRYQTINDIETKFNKKIKFIELKTKKEKEILFIEGYPIKHNSYFLVENDDKFYIYSKREGSLDLYVAGYFCIEFKGKWQSSFCPRLRTLEDHKWKGPFKDQMTMNHTIRMENKK